MPTEFLCKSCQLPGTSYSERGKGVTIAPKPDEPVRFFHLDCVAFRNHYNLSQDAVCDLLVEYGRRTTPPIDLFTELKGAGGIDHAKRQIVGAFVVLEKELLVCQDGVRFRALIVTSASAPPNWPKLVSELRKVGFEDVKLRTGVKGGRKIDLREFVA
jgi:hypothetical protein